jgi:hypothetical protein
VFPTMHARARFLHNLSPFLHNLILTKQLYRLPIANGLHYTNLDKSCAPYQSHP